MSEIESIGEGVINEIIKQGMINVVPPVRGQEGHIFVWNGNAVEQLDAYIEDQIEKRNS